MPVGILFNYMSEKKIKYIYALLLSFIPISIIVGPAISLMNILLISLTAIFLIVSSKKIYFLKNTEILALTIIFVYLLFNTYISLITIIVLLKFPDF